MNATQAEYWITGGLTWEWCAIGFCPDPFIDEPHPATQRAGTGAPPLHSVTVLLFRKIIYDDFE